MRKELKKMKSELFQVSSLQALLMGYYRKVITVKELREHGDTGLGTFAQADGEMIMLEGHVYQALYDGTVREAEDAEGIPFGTVSFFDASETTDFEASGMEEVRNKLDAAVQAHASHMAFVKLEGQFDLVHYRSGMAVPLDQEIPLADWLKNHQNEWTAENIAGTAVGVYFPSFMDRLNTPGWHVHFLSADHSRGGHVLDMASSHLKLSVSFCRGFAMRQPEDERYETLDLTLDQREAIERAEK